MAYPVTGCRLDRSHSKLLGFWRTIPVSACQSSSPSLMRNASAFPPSVQTKSLPPDAAGERGSKALAPCWRLSCQSFSSVWRSSTIRFSPDERNGMTFSGDLRSWLGKRDPPKPEGTRR